MAVSKSRTKGERRALFDPGRLNYYIRGDNLKLMVNYIHTWSDFRGANPEFGDDQFDEVIGRMQLMF